VVSAVFFYFYPLIWQHYYADFIIAVRNKGISDSLLYAIYGSIQFALIHAIGAIIFTFIHMNEFPFFEQFKSFDEPWPWNADKEAWKKQKWSTIKLVFVNICIVTPLAGAMNYFTGIPVANDFSVEGLPSTKKFFI
jgi:hypothetical protein